LGEYTLAVAQTRGELDALQIEALHALLADVPDD
jgi:hypothetical protein